MHLIIGGAYQGKLEFAKAKYGFKNDQIYTCTSEGAIDFSCPCVRHIEEFVYGCVLRGESPIVCFEENRALWQDSVLICREIGGGIVPISHEERVWREETGALCRYLAENAGAVSRVYLGIEQRLK